MLIAFHRLHISYDSERKTLHTVIDSDEFLDSAKDYCPNINLKRKETEVDIVAELNGSSDYDLTEKQLDEIASRLGDFSGKFFFYIKPSSVDCEKFYINIMAAFPDGKRM